MKKKLQFRAKVSSLHIGHIAVGLLLLRSIPVLEGLRPSEFFPFGSSQSQLQVTPLEVPTVIICSQAKMAKHHPISCLKGAPPGNPYA